MTENDYLLNVNEMNGYCKNCKKVTNYGDIEQDAEDYQCDDCGQHTVVGVEQALIEGLIVIDEDAVDDDEDDDDDIEDEEEDDEE